MKKKCSSKIFANIVTFIIFLVVSAFLGTSEVLATNDPKQTEFISLDNSNPEESVPFQVKNMFPGDALEQYYRVKTSSSDSVTVSFRAEIRNGYEKLSEVLQLKVKLADTDELLYEGLMKDMPQVDCVLAANTTAKELYYEIIVSLDTSVGNEYQNQSLVADFNWLVAVEEPPLEEDEEDQPDDSQGGASQPDDSQGGSSQPGESQGGASHPSESQSSDNLPGVNTGDESQLGVWVVVTLLAMVIFICVLLKYRKMKKGSLCKSRSRLFGGFFSIILLIAGLGITTLALSYYKMSVEENLFETGKLSINLNDGIPVINEDEFLFEPGMTVVKEFFLKNESTCDVYYKLYFSDISGKLAEVLEVTIKEGDNVLYQGILADMTRENMLAADDMLQEGELREMEVYFHFPQERSNEAQNHALDFTICADAVQVVNNPDRLFD